MATTVPQDFSDINSILSYLETYAIATGNTEMREVVKELKLEYSNVMEEPSDADKLTLPYNRKDAYSIFEYLKLQAEQLSQGRWTDFSDSDIGTVFLKLMSYLADMNNFQVDKVASELYLDTCLERSSAISLAKLVGYEPRHYLSAHTEVTLGNVETRTVPDGTSIPAYTTFTDSTNEIVYTTLDEYKMYGNKAKVTAYEGVMSTKQYTIDNISATGKIVLPDYNIGINTLKVYIDGQEYQRVEDVRFISGELGFSVHMSEESFLYLQLPAYWPDVINRGSTITVRYLLSTGADGRIGKNILSRIEQMNSEYRNYMTVISNTASLDGYNPETVDEMRDSIPMWARTMNTIVTIKDFEEVSMAIPGISEVQALDYNDKSSGLVQPDDYYKVNLYVLPNADIKNYDATNVKYRNTVIKDKQDWTVEDMSKVADAMDEFSKDAISGNTIVLSNAATLYTIDNIAVGINMNTGIESDNYLLNDSTPIKYTISQSGTSFNINLSTGWREQLADNQYVDVFYITEQVLTETGQQLREYVDERRLTSLKVTYHDLEIVTPTIIVDVYMNKNDIRFNITSDAIKTFILERFSREYMKIGEPLFASVIGHEILANFDYIRYCEVRDPEEKIEVLPRGFIDIVPNAIEGNILVNKIIVNVHDYQNKD